MVLGLGTYLHTQMTLISPKCQRTFPKCYRNEKEVPWQKPFSEEPFHNVKEPFQNVKEPFQHIIGMSRKGSLTKSFHGGTFLCQKERFKKAFLGEFGTFLWRFWNLSVGSFLVKKNLSFQICPTGP